MAAMVHSWNMFSMPTLLEELGFCCSVSMARSQGIYNGGDEEPGMVEEQEWVEWLVGRGAGALVVAPGAGGAGRAQVTSVSRVQTMEGETCDTS